MYILFRTKVYCTIPGVSVSARMADVKENVEAGNKLADKHNTGKLLYSNIT